MAQTVIARIHRLRFYVLGLCVSGVLAACAMVPPVQEMSDARQAIRAAQEANAREHAPENLLVAEGLMDKASHNLDRGAYEEARREAKAAREQAIQARNLSLSKIGSQPADFR